MTAVFPLHRSVVLFLSMLILGTGIKAVGDTISWSVFNAVGVDDGAEGDKAEEKNGADEVDGIGTIPWTRFNALGIDNVLEVDAVQATCRVDELDNIDTLSASGGVEVGGMVWCISVVSAAAKSTSLNTFRFVGKIPVLEKPETAF